MNRLVISLFCSMCFACAFQSTGTKTTDDEWSIGGASQVDSFSNGGSVTQISLGGSGGNTSIPVSTGGLSGFGGASTVLTGGSTSQTAVPATGGNTIATGGRENTGGQLNQTGGMSTGGVATMGGMSATGGVTIIASTGGSVSKPTIALASDTLPTTKVLRGSLEIPLLRIWVFGDLSNFPITALKIQDIGSGHRVDVSGVYLYDDTTNTRLTTVRTITSSTKTLTFNGLNISTPTTITVMCDISNSATLNRTHIFQLTDASYVTLRNNGVILGAFPITSNAITVVAP